MATLLRAEPRSAHLVPVPYRVAARRRDTADVVTLTLDPAGGEALDWSPGQYNMLYAFAVGEVPISISGGDGDRLLHTVRDVGAVSHALCGAHLGDVVGVRGAFGSDWGLDAAAGGDLVIVAGGIGLAPLRSAVVRVLAERERFGEVQLVVGARTAEDLLYREEVEAWRARRDLDVHVTVDRWGPGWRGTIGVVTRVLPRLPIAPDATALVCGPEVMMRLTARALLDRGLSPARIRVSAERTMQCAVARCGHCQLGAAFVCVDGPVFGWDRLEPLLGVREL